MVNVKHLIDARYPVTSYYFLPVTHVLFIDKHILKCSELYHNVLINLLHTKIFSNKKYLMDAMSDSNDG